MIKCEICATPNRLDGKFCRECGTPLPVAAVEAARGENQRLVDDGYRLFQEGRTDEALLAAETALERDPEFAAAFALRGDVRERTGDLGGALEDYERVVELSPDSTLERLKLAHLRKLLSLRALEAPAPPNRRLAVLAGVAATVLVVCLGSAIALMNQPPGTQPNQAATGSEVAQDTLSVVPLVPNPNGVNPAGMNPAGVNPNGTAPGATPAPGAPTASSATPAPTPAPPIPNRPGGAIRMPQDFVSNSGSGNRPLLPPVGPELQISPTQAAATTPSPTPTPTQRPSVDEEPGPMPDPTGPAPTNAAGTRPNPPRNPGIIDIRPSPGQPRQVGGSETIPPARSSTNGDVGTPGEARNQAEALVQTARQQFQMGDYARAADAYEKALAAGADPASVNQRLGQAYERLNRRSDAISAYNRSVRAFEAALQAGKGDPARLRAGLNAAQQALRQLQGG